MEFHCIKMRYSIEAEDRMRVKGYGFLSFAKNMGKNVSNKYGQKLVDSAKKSTIDGTKTASKRVFEKKVEATGNLIGNKIADKITSASKNYSKQLQSKKSQNDYVNNETEAPKERYTSPEKRQQIIDELRLV